MRLLTALLLLGNLLVVNEQGRTIARVQERRGSIDVFDADSGRVGWGRTNRDGTIELFDVRGRRLLILELGRGVIRLRK